MNGWRITGARARLLRAPVGDGIAMSFAPMAHRTMVLVTVETADGRVGHGESWANYPAWAPAERLATLREGVFPLLIGEDARHVEDIQARLVTALEPLGRQWGAPGPIMQAISGVDTALWDLRGRAAGTAIAESAGGRFRDDIPVYASSLGPDGVARLGGRCRAEGHTAVKVKLGFGRERDEAILASARHACGPDVTLHADANQGWSLDGALAMAPLLRRYAVDWIEEPVRGNRLEDLEEFHRRSGIPVATGENIYGLDAFRRYAASPAVEVLQPDIAKAGGLTEALAIARAAGENGTRVMPHLYAGAVAFAATLQLAACAPAVTAIEYDIRDNPLRDPLVVAPPHPVAGRIDLPRGPGLGLDLDPAAIDAHHEGEART